MRRISVAGLMLMLTLAAAGCRPVAAVGGGTAYNVIPVDQRTSESGRSMYDVVAMRWPLMMNAASTASHHRQLGREPVGVYANRAYLGGVSMLRSVRAHEVASVRRLSRSEEYSHYGRAHESGAIEIVWRNSVLGAR